MNQTTLDTLNIIEKRAEYKRMDEAVREELLKLIAEIKDEIITVVEGAVENEKFQNLEEMTNEDFPGFESDEPFIDWVNFHPEATAKEDMLDNNFKPKNLDFYAMDQFKS